MTYEEALAYIHSVSWKGSHPGLSRTRELLAKMGNPEKNLRYIHIVGTNGKGSTAAMLAKCLMCAGFRTGLYISPFLFCFEERMQVDGVPIGREELAEIIEEIQPLAAQMEDAPTEFELVTAAAFRFFERQRAEIVVLEAGMGGELDSTNVIPAPEAAVICNIGLDHTDYLGDTLEKIAATKAKIVKPGSSCVFYGGEKSVSSVIEARCREVGAPLLLADAPQPLSHNLDGQYFSCGDYVNLKLSLLGRHQLKNAAVVLKTLEALREKGFAVSEAAVREGLSSVKWHGRFEVVSRAPLFIVDGGHNPQCIEALTRNIEDYLPGTDLTVLTGVLEDKDYPAMYRALMPYARRFVTVTPPSPRALAGQVLAEFLRSCGAEAESAESIPAGVERAKALARENGGAVLACGSLYMAGDIITAARK